MSVASGRPPSLSSNETSSILTKYFNFKAVDSLSIKAFPSYRDRNYYFQGDYEDFPKDSFVFKLSNPLSTSFDVMEGINKAMKHLHCHSLLSPSPLTTHTGKDLIQLSSAQLKGSGSKEGNGVQHYSNQQDSIMKYPVYVLSFIPGQIFDHVNKKHLTPSLLYQVGELLGRIDKELMENFSCKALATRKNSDWDLMHFLGMRRYLEELEDPSQAANGEKIFKAFEEHVAPHIPSFKRGVIHGDLNGLNIVLKDKHPEGYDLAGFIDFNDAVRTCTIFEVGISLAYIMQENLHPVTCHSAAEFVGPMIAAYHSILPFSAEELDCLYYLVLARCCQTALNGLRAHKVEPWNSYLLTTPQKSWVLINELLNTPKQVVDETWRKFINKY